MKKIYRYTVIPALALCTLTGCKKMDEIYKDFIVPGGLPYAGRVTNPLIQSGRQRIKISWLRGADPSVNLARIFWNNYADSVNVPIPATGDTINVIIDKLEEKPYTFVARTYDQKGNKSVPVELLGESFGDKYQSLLVTRPVVTSENIGSALTINWSNANKSGGAYVTEVEYTNTANTSAVKRFSVDEISSVIADYKPGTSYKYRTEYRPGNSIDPFNTAYATQFVSVKIPKAGLVVTADSFAATSQLPLGGSAQFAFDDDVNTFWHTHHTPAPVPVFPHWLMVDLRKIYKVTRVELFSRPGVTNGFAEFTVQGSMNGTSWTDYGSFTKIQKDPGESFMLKGGAATMRYLRLYITAPAVAGQAHTNLADFSVYGYE